MDRLVALGSHTQNGITDFFAKIGRFDEACAKNSDGTETCVDADQLKSLLTGSAATDTTIGGSVGPAVAPASPGESAGTATTTTPASVTEADVSPVETTLRAQPFR